MCRGSGRAKEETKAREKSIKSVEQQIAGISMTDHQEVVNLRYEIIEMQHKLGELRAMLNKIDKKK